MAADIVFTTVNLPPAFAGAAYEAAIAYKSAGSLVTAQSVASGSLPPGVTLDTVGAAPGSLRLSGTPTAVGTYTFAVTATDTAGAATSSNYTITVYPFGDFPWDERTVAQIIHAAWPLTA